MFGFELPSEMAADLVLLGGKVLTVDPENRVAEAVAVKYGRIIKVGSNGDVKRLIGPSTRVIELEGRLVLPGVH